MKQCPPPPQSSVKSSILTRRNLLLLLGGSIAALTGWRWFTSSTKSDTTSPESVSGNILVTATQQTDFLALSTILTSHQHLSPETSPRIFNALSAQSSEFQLRAVALFQFIQQHQLNDVDSIVNRLKNNAELAPLETVLRQIIAAWYLGVAGDGVHSKVVAWESALMFDQVRDVVGVPSYCPAETGYWSMQPPTLKAG